MSTLRTVRASPSFLSQSWYQHAISRCRVRNCVPKMVNSSVHDSLVLSFLPSHTVCRGFFPHLHRVSRKSPTLGQGRFPQRSSSPFSNSDVPLDAYFSLVNPFAAYIYIIQNTYCQLLLHRTGSQHHAQPFFSTTSCRQLAPLITLLDYLPKIIRF